MRIVLPSRTRQHGLDLFPLLPALREKGWRITVLAKHTPMPELWAYSSLDEELAMTEFVEMKIQVAVVTLAEELNYARASEMLNITQLELNRQITDLESQLDLQVFRVSGEDVEVTEAGQVFVNACRTFLATRSRQGAKNKIRN
jgi:hypothetical protein